MMVLCGVAPFAYKREDGIYVVPVTNQMRHSLEPYCDCRTIVAK